MGLVIRTIRPQEEEVAAPGAEIPGAEALRYGLLKCAKGKAEDKRLKPPVEDKHG